jgi:uncharacterized phage protein (predicted DNA packaging)
MALTIDKLKNELRIDGSDDDDYLTDLMSQAQNFIMNAVDSDAKLDDYEKLPIFDRAVALLVGNWYFNRSTSLQSKPYDNLYGVDAMIGQLRGLMWVDDSDGSNS